MGRFVHFRNRVQGSYGRQVTRLRLTLPSKRDIVAAGRSGGRDVAEVVLRRRPFARLAGALDAPPAGRPWPPPPARRRRGRRASASARRRLSVSSVSGRRWSPRCPASAGPRSSTGEPLVRYSPATSAVRPQSVTSTNVVSSIHSPLAFLRRSLTARPMSRHRRAAGNISQLRVPREVAQQDDAVITGHGRSPCLLSSFRRATSSPVLDLLTLLHPVPALRCPRSTAATSATAAGAAASSTRGAAPTGQSGHGRPGRRRSADRPSGTSPQHVLVDLELPFQGRQLRAGQAEIGQPVGSFAMRLDRVGQAALFPKPADEDFAAELLDRAR